MQLLTLGIPCLYYGTEQGFAGPEKMEWQWLPEWDGHDRYLREAMFGPRFPRAAGRGRSSRLSGRQYVRHVSVFGEPWGQARAGELLSWSRILVDEEALCIINPNGLEARGADVLVGAELNPPDSTFTVIMNSAEAAGGPAGDHSVGNQIPVRRTPSGTAYVEIRNVGPSEALVLINRP